MRPGHVTISWLHFEHLHWSGSADLWSAFSSLGIDGSLTMPNQGCMVDVEEFPSLRSSRNSQLQQHCEVKHCHAKEELRVLRSTILNFNRWNLFAHNMNDRMHVFFCPLFQYGCHLETTAVSVHVTLGGDYYCYLVVNVCTNWIHACQLNAGILSVGIKQGTLLFELPSSVVHCCGKG
jgi:hypothetical protein